MSIICLEDSKEEIVVKMSGGCPMAREAMNQMIKLPGGIENILSLATLGIYENEIGYFYSTVCNKDIFKMILIVEASRAWVITAYNLNQICKGNESVNFEEIIKKM